MLRNWSVAFAVLTAFTWSCASTNDKTDTTPTVDSGKPKDSGGVKDSSTIEEDTSTSPGDTGTPVVTDTGSGGGGDTGKSDAPAGGCDMHAGDECDMVKQNCADPTHTCNYDPTKKHNVCVKMATGTKLAGESCASQSECDKGLFCYSNKCSPACCSGDDSTCGAGGTCNLAITEDGGAVIYHACSYASKCDPFKYNCPTGQVCIFNADPDVFKCSSPASGSSGLGTAPGGTCKYTNDCGESQGCFKYTGDTDFKCYLFCYLTPPDGFTPGASAGGRFPANGTCTVGGVNYGTCTMAADLGGGLGLCRK